MNIGVFNLILCFGKVYAYLIFCIKYYVKFDYQIFKNIAL